MLTLLCFSGSWMRNIPINGPLLREKACHFAAMLEVENFQGSIGWLNRFRDRYGVVAKVICGEASDAPAQSISEWRSGEIAALIENYSPDNADEAVQISFKKFSWEQKWESDRNSSRFQFAQNVNLSLSSRRRRPEDGAASETDWFRRTALHRAALSGDTQRIRELLEGGWNTRARDLNGMTPLHLALLYEKEAAAELLADADCITDVVDFYKRTPLHLAAECGFVNVVRILLAGGANASAKDRSESTPLHFAVISRMEAAAEVLLEAAAECDGPDMEGRTPLHYAVREGLPRIVQSLLSRGARLKLKDRDGHCPLYLALWCRQDDVARVLLATHAWRNIEVHWEEMGLPQEQKERGVRLLSECEAEMREALVEGSRLSLRDLAHRHPSRLAQRLTSSSSGWGRSGRGGPWRTASCAASPSSARPCPPPAPTSSSRAWRTTT
ncbi:ankyrin repeat domain-containing protein 23-like [Uloborus diversus]|uniref:ankyrin repeat domain-containing protein 23-like n=1 Tax=Uloborus diversus TaxID=327109 RepID=UPI0024091F43|nr:ankyrin repeat domain-containing protein 23-like [Uloborus diversus]